LTLPLPYHNILLSSPEDKQKISSNLSTSTFTLTKMMFLHLTTIAFASMLFTSISATFEVETWSGANCDGVGTRISTPGTYWDMPGGSFSVIDTTSGRLTTWSGNIIFVRVKVDVDRLLEIFCLSSGEDKRMLWYGRGRVKVAL